MDSVEPLWYCVSNMNTISASIYLSVALLFMVIPFELCIEVFLNLLCLVLQLLTIPEMFWSLDFPLEYWIELVALKHLWVNFIFSTREFQWGVAGFITGCHLGGWRRSLDHLSQYVSPLFVNLILNGSCCVCLTQWRMVFLCFHFIHIFLSTYMYIMHIS